MTTKAVIMDTDKKIIVGTKVQNISKMWDVPLGCFGYCISTKKKRGRESFVIAWDRPGNPYPHHMEAEDIAKMWGVKTGCPMRDTFSHFNWDRFIKVVTNGEQ